jgi:phosphonopyruvate decarboxylase
MMTMTEAVGIVAANRGEAIVISSQSARIPWMHVSSNPSLDILFAGSMSKESSVGLGIAMACPDRKVIVLSGDGELLMNLGTLVTIAGQAPRNYFHFVMQNDVYEFTGGQPIPGSTRLDFAGLAREAGYPVVHTFDAKESFSTGVKDILNETGPVFTCLRLEPKTAGDASPKGPYPWEPLKKYLHGLRRVLTGTE